VVGSIIIARYVIGSPTSQSGECFVTRDLEFDFSTGGEIDR
jgi:hypothetical protein